MVAPGRALRHWRSHLSPRPSSLPRQSCQQTCARAARTRWLLPPAQPGHVVGGLHPKRSNRRRPVAPVRPRLVPVCIPAVAHAALLASRRVHACPIASRASVWQAYRKGQMIAAAMRWGKHGPQARIWLRQRSTPRAARRQWIQRPQCAPRCAGVRCSVLAQATAESSDTSSAAESSAPDSDSDLEI